MSQTFRERKGLKEPQRDEEKDLSSYLEWTSIIFPVQHPALNLSLGSPEAEPEKELRLCSQEQESEGSRMDTGVS